MKIQIENLRFKTIIGILNFERVKKQYVVVDLEFLYDFKNGDFIDYSEVANLIKKRMRKKKFLLIEDALLDIEKNLKKKYNIQNLKLKITKPDILKNCLVSVSTSNKLNYTKEAIVSTSAKK